MTTTPQPVPAPEPAARECDVTAVMGRHTTSTPLADGGPVETRDFTLRLPADSPELAMRAVPAIAAAVSIASEGWVLVGKRAEPVPADGPASTSEPEQAPAGTSGGSGSPQDGTGDLSASEAIAHLIQDATANARVANDNSNKREMVRWLETAKWLERERDFLGIAAPATPNECSRCSGTGWEPDCGRRQPRLRTDPRGCDGQGAHCAQHGSWTVPSPDMPCRECGGHSRRAWAVIPADGPRMEPPAHPHDVTAAAIASVQPGGQGPDWPGDIEAPDADALAAVYDGALPCECNMIFCGREHAAGLAELWRDGYRTGWAARGEDRAVEALGGAAKNAGQDQASEPETPTYFTADELFAAYNRGIEHGFTVTDGLREVAEMVDARLRAELDRLRGEYDKATTYAANFSNQLIAEKAAHQTTRDHAQDLANRLTVSDAEKDQALVLAADAVDVAASWGARGASLARLDARLAELRTTGKEQS